jgi:hypothetical protein
MLLTNKVLIESAKVTVPTVGHAAERKAYWETLFQSNPQLAESLTTVGGYDPKSTYDQSDDFAIFNWEWTVGPDNTMWCGRSFLPVAAVERLVKTGLTVGNKLTDANEIGAWSEYGYNLRASYALEVLKHLGKVPEDSVIVNQDDMPYDYANEVEVAEAAAGGVELN